MPSTSNRRCVEGAALSLWDAFTRAVGLGAALILAILSAFVLSAGAAPDGATTHIVVIDRMAFSPATVRVKPGDRVTFRNQDIVPHTATSKEAKLFDSGIIQPGASWTVSPPLKASMSYVCTLHPTMSGEIVADGP